MKVRDLDTHHDSGNKPLALCVRWLRSCLAQCIHWDPQQRAAAEIAAQEAENVLDYELSPNMDAPSAQALLVPIEAAASPLAAIQGRATPGAWVDVSPDDLSRLYLYEETMRSKLRAMDAVLRQVALRIAFIGWPAESHWRDGDGDHQRWVPDWRQEIAMIEAVRHGRPLDLLEERSDTLPWYRIPQEFRPSHKSEGAQRLHKLHLAWLRYREGDEDGHERTEMTRLLALKEAMRDAFERRPVEAVL